MPRPPAPVRLSRKITDRTAELTAAAAASNPNARHLAEHHAGVLRFDAYLAYLAGRVARDKALRREADKVLRAIREQSA